MVPSFQNVADLISKQHPPSLLQSSGNKRHAPCISIALLQWFWRIYVTPGKPFLAHLTAPPDVGVTPVLCGHTAAMCPGTCMAESLEML